MADRLLELRTNAAWQKLKLRFLEFPRQVQLEINESNQRFAAKKWPGALAEQGPSKAQRRVLTDGADVRVGRFGVTLRAANSGASLSGGLNTSTGRNWAGFEFGGVPQVKSVTRMGTRRDQLINVQFAPRRSKGKVVYAAARMIGPTMVGRWTSAIVKAFANGHPDIKTR